MAELKKTSAGYWILESIKADKLSYDNPLKYQDYRICNSDGLHRKPFVYVHDDYDGASDANDRRHGFGDSIEDCIHQINQYILENVASLSNLKPDKPAGDFLYCKKDSVLKDSNCNSQCGMKINFYEKKKRHF